MTSNIGASEIARNTPLGFAVSDDETGITYDDMKNRIMGELKKVFRPEFLNRIDEVIVFHKLTKDEIKEIVELLLRRIRESMAERELQLELSEPTKDLLVEEGWDPSMGARPLRRAIQRLIEDPLADFVIRTQAASGSTVLVDVEQPPEDGEKKKPEVTLSSYGDMKNRIMSDLKKVFRPEFLNRIDEVIVFHKLAKDEVKEIIDLMIARVRVQVAEHELQLELTDEAKELLVDKGWDPSMGARPLRRAIQRYVEDPLADEVLRQGEMTPGSTVMVSRDESGDEDDKPLSLEIIAPKKPKAKAVEKPRREKVGVGAKKDDDSESAPEGESPEGAGDTES